MPGAPVRYSVKAFHTVHLTSAAQVLDMSVRAQARIVREIPAKMVRVFIDRDLIASPIPARDDVVIVRSDIPVEIAEPEALAASARESKCSSKSAAVVSVRPGLGDPVMRVVGTTIVSHPLIVPGVNVRNIRMTLLVHGNVVLCRGVMPLAAGRVGHSRWSGTVSGDMPTTDRGRAAVARSDPVSLLRESRQAG